jgi:GTP-binding protein
MRTKEMLEKANMALVILRCFKRPLTDLDEKIAGLVDEYGSWYYYCSK